MYDKIHYKKKKKLALIVLDESVFPGRPVCNEKKENKEMEPERDKCSEGVQVLVLDVSEIQGHSWYILFLIQEF